MFTNKIPIDVYYEDTNNGIRTAIFEEKRSQPFSLMNRIYINVDQRPYDRYWSIFKNKIKGECLR